MSLAKNTDAMLTRLLKKQEKLQEELRNLEKQVYELETRFLQDSCIFGNSLKGHKDFLSSSKSTASTKRSRKYQPEDRIFSLSSATSPAAEELGVRRDDERTDVWSALSKGGASSVRQVKPKKRKELRIIREVKFRRRSNESGFDDDDDDDCMSLR